MPADQSEERKAAMAAFGAELISVPSSSDGGGMEAARDMASRMQVRPPLQVCLFHQILMSWLTVPDSAKRHHYISMCIATMSFAVIKQGRLCTSGDMPCCKSHSQISNCNQGLSAFAIKACQQLQSRPTFRAPSLFQLPVYLQHHTQWP